MLLSLQIENYAIIKSLEITFNDGFTSITGETGTGKSILLGALSLILGNRVETPTFFDSTQKCIIEASFSMNKNSTNRFFTENDIDYQDITIIRREISPNGKSRAFINDTPVSLLQLKDLTHQLIDIHSQHGQLLLANQDFKMQIIDDYAKNSSLIDSYKEYYDKYKQIASQLNLLKEEQAKIAQERDFITFLSNELTEANLYPKEDIDIEKQIQLLNNAEEIKSHLYSASQLIGEEENNILQLLKSVEQHCKTLEKFDSQMENYTKRLQNVQIELKDIDFDLNKKERETEINPSELERLSERLDRIYTLEKKHNVNDVEALIEKNNDFQNKLLQFSDNQSFIENLEKEYIQIQNELKQKAVALSQKRKEAIQRLQKALKEKLIQLNIPDGELTLELEQKDSFFKNGIDEINFYFSANKGFAPTLLEKTASGGELSRIILAIKSIITESAMLPTIIFDEIDSGISGVVAGKTADLMQKMSENHQLIVITHLPQIAAKSQFQYRVYKEKREEKTVSNIKLLSYEERIDEIATMISGNKLGDNSRLAAQELLQNNQ